MFGINGAELLVIMVVALILVGPDHLPQAARQVRDVAAALRETVRKSQASVSQELGSDVDWRTLDPRRYNPKVIVSQALFGDEPEAPSAPTAPQHRPVTGQPGARTPVDHEAT